LSSGHICIHGHWYQPPRENPFTGVVDDQPSAAPYANWNERITAECYEPNSEAKILAEDGSVRRTLNNYCYVSSDWGPTLLDWLDDHHPDLYQRIIDADLASRERFGGHGTAMAQAYNHTILPLSNRRDKRTQILWGIADFESRFGRSPEGMWLPETAVDLESLELMADTGVGFTVLSPYQAAWVLDGSEWIDVVGGSIDTRVPYTVQLFGGRSISVFFYDGPLSQEIAFNGVLDDGAILAKRLVQGLGEPSADTRLVNVATDGETYGHHHRFGEMALARAIEEIESDPDITLTTYAQFLASSPPTRIVRIIEATSWSCAHGVDRWRSDCGCDTGRHPEWNQEWRSHLREAMDLLRDAVAEEFDVRGGTLLIDPWLARDEYVEVLLGGSTERFLDRHMAPGAGESRPTALALLEAQRHAMLMYTSCGWFFDDLAGLEGVFVLRHAGKLIQLTRDVSGLDLEAPFLEVLERAESNRGGTGRDVYETEVAPFIRAEAV